MQRDALGLLPLRSRKGALCGGRGVPAVPRHAAGRALGRRRWSNCLPVIHLRSPLVNAQHHRFPGALTAPHPAPLRVHHLGPLGDRLGRRGHALTGGRSGRDTRRQILALWPTVHGAVKPTSDTARPLSGDS